VARSDRQLIELHLLRPDDMFQLPQSDLFSDYRNFLTGVESCVSALRGGTDRRPVRLQIWLPASEIDDGLSDRLARTLRRYCDNRITYNHRERRATRLGGISALRIGLPIAALGLVLTVVAIKTESESTVARLVEDHLGWVLAWIGLWFPLDAMLFYPLAYSRENRVLALLRDADVVITPYADQGSRITRSPTAT
jgi:hypothetical protein